MEYKKFQPEGDTGKLENKAKDGDLKEGNNNKYNPTYEVVDNSFNANPYSVDCCRCNPQRC